MHTNTRCFHNLNKLLRQSDYNMHTACAKEISVKYLDGIAIFQDAVGKGF